MIECVCVMMRACVDFLMIECVCVCDDDER